MIPCDDDWKAPQFAQGRIVFVHEGGYSVTGVPYAGLRGLRDPNSTMDL